MSFTKLSISAEQATQMLEAAVAKADGQLAGGIGASGGHYTQDMEIAQAALAAVVR